MTLTLYQIDAFTSKLFGGNPAAVIPLDKWLDDVLMQKIALENNLSETVFLVPVGGNSYPFGGGHHPHNFQYLPKVDYGKNLIK